MRRHVLILCDGDVIDQVEAVRRRWDPVMAARMPAHVTLAYPEEVDDLDLLRERLTAEAATTRGFPLDIDGLFARDGGAYLHAVDRIGSLTRLRDRLLAPPFRPAGFPAHITICHPRTAPNAADECVEREDAPTGSIMAQELCLTETTDAGMRIIDRFPLVPAFAQVVAGALRRDGRLLLAHRVATRRRYPNVWDLPGGHVDDGELGAAALRRELIEEIDVDVGRLAADPDVVVALRDGDLAIWRIDEWRGEPLNVAPDEHDELRWCAPGDWSGLELANAVTNDLLRELLDG